MQSLVTPLRSIINFDRGWRLLGLGAWSFLTGAVVSLLALALARGPGIEGLIPICGLAQSGSEAEAPFLTENDASMNKMMTGMAIRPSGDVDDDFVAMMVPHHQGAIDMAQAELRYGHNEKLRRMAQEIIVTQQQEIAAMRLALGQPLPPSLPAPDQQLSIANDNARSALQ